MASCTDKIRKRRVDSDDFNNLYTKYAEIEPRDHAEAFRALMEEMGIMTAQLGKSDVLPLVGVHVQSCFTEESKLTFPFTCNLVVPG